MLLTFEKQIVNNFFIEGRGVLENCIVYKVYMDNFQVGSFFLKHELCFFNYQSQRYFIRIQTKGFKKSKYDIIDDFSQKKIGEYVIPKFVGLFIPLGKLHLYKEDGIYVCNKLEATGLLFSENKSKWGNYCVGLSNKKNTIVYRIVLNGPKTFHDRHSLPSSGLIEFEVEDPVVVMAGIFLVEQTLIADDAPDL